MARKRSQVGRTRRGSSRLAAAKLSGDIRLLHQQEPWSAICDAPPHFVASVTADRIVCKGAVSG